MGSKADDRERRERRERKEEKHSGRRQGFCSTGPPLGARAGLMPDACLMSSCLRRVAVPALLQAWFKT